MTKDNRIHIRKYEQAADEKVSLDGIKWLRKWDVCVQCDSAEEAEALRARLTQPESDPVAWKMKGVPAFATSRPNDTDSIKWDALYTAPPQRGWVGLTDKDIEDCLEMSIQGTCRAIEAKLKGKNG